MISSTKIHIRTAKKEDLPDLVEIYNQAIEARGATAHLTTFKVEGRIEWFNSHQPNQYPILVAVQNHKIVGYASLSPYREGRKGLEPTVELSYYVHNNHHKKGVGSSLLEAGIITAKKLGYKNVFGILLSGNEASIALLNKFNFKLWAQLPRVAKINGEYIDHLYYGREI